MKEMPPENGLVTEYFDSRFHIIPNDFTQFTKELIRLNLDDVRIDTASIKTPNTYPSPAGVYHIDLTQTLFYTSFSESDFSREYKFVNSVERLDLNPQPRLEDESLRNNLMLLVSKNNLARLLVQIRDLNERDIESLVNPIGFIPNHLKLEQSYPLMNFHELKQLLHMVNEGNGSIYEPWITEFLEDLECPE